MSRDTPPAANESVAPDGYRTQSADTAFEIERRLVDAWRRMPSWEKARQLVACCHAVEELATAGLRLRHPCATEHELRMRLAAMRLERALMIDVYGWDPDAPDG
ncbi:MAG: hypothetical protein ACRDF6_07265 [bacterium]